MNYLNKYEKFSLHESNKYEEEIKSEEDNNISISINIPKSFISHMNKLNIPEQNYSKVFSQYVEELIGIPYGQELDLFNYWTDEADNITDYQSDYTENLEEKFVGHKRKKNTLYESNKYEEEIIDPEITNEDGDEGSGPVLLKEGDEIDVEGISVKVTKILSKIGNGLCISFEGMSDGKKVHVVCDDAGGGYQFA